MCYTSGTTGNPKGVAYSHRSTYLHSLAATSAANLGISGADRILVVVPQFHANAWGIPYAAWLSGADLIMPKQFLQAEPLVRIIESRAADVRRCGADDLERGAPLCRGARLGPVVVSLDRLRRVGCAAAR